MHNFKELKIWKLGMDISMKTYYISKNFPEDKRFGLVSQIRRCAISIPSNIAEGSGRGTNADFNRFVDYSLASSFELETQLLLANDLFGIDISDILGTVSEFQRMTIGFKKTL
jgi:four helix bundle protein